MYGINKKISRADFKRLAFGHAREAISGLVPSGRIIGLTKGHFSLIQMIAAILEKTGPADIVVSTWSAGVYDGGELSRLRDSGLIRSVLIITDRSYVTRQSQYAIGIEKLFGPECIRTTNTHAKFVLIGNDSWNICIRSSMNLNENRRCENFDLDDDPGVYDFYMDFVKEVFESMPEGFISERGVIDPVFDGLFGGGTGKKVRSGYVIRNARGDVLHKIHGEK